MKDALYVYLQDHLAGAVFGVELVEALEHEHEANELGRLARTWKREIQEDQATLRRIAERVGATPSTVKEVVSWISERATRLKLRRHSHGALGAFESLETLALGISGKEKLWQALETAAQTDTRLDAIDFVQLQQRARAQHDSVEAFRRTLAASVFNPATTT
ncbi:MAG: hypothetical protein ABIZ04_22615 [Opitutus sp.]